uniref:Major facilitator superfamily (MFS) profile domain-containing protein n=1 Tax=Kalanchoe fedtschenkoi TaxID=63787 RepID=A0A7N0TP63_KALFE
MADGGGGDGRAIRAGAVAVADDRLGAGLVAGCPGCKVDAEKAASGRIPYLSFGFVWAVVLAASLPVASQFPFLYYMVKDFHVADREEHIGYYAGVIGSAYMVGRALSSIPWGVAADHYGRKPVIVSGTIAVVIFNTLFGFSNGFWMAVTSRFLLGFLCGVYGPAKAYVMEVCRTELLLSSQVSTSWSLGLVLGPAIRGFLEQPAEKLSLVPKGSLLGSRFPYALPCLVISVTALVTAIACCWLPESLHNHAIDTKSEQEMTRIQIAALDDQSSSPPDTPLKQGCFSSQLSLLKNWPLMSSILVYCVFQLHDTAFSEVFSLWAISPRPFGGLSFSTSKVGLVLSIAGAGLFVFQLFLYPFVERILGPLSIARIGAILSLPLIATFPAIATLRGVGITTGLMILQNRAVSQNQRGAANGIAMAAQSSFKAFGPAIGGALLSWAQSRRHASFLPGSQMLYFLLGLTESVALPMSFKPFLALPPKEDSQDEKNDVA